MDQNEFEQDMQTCRRMMGDISQSVAEVKNRIAESADWSEVERARDVLAGMREVMAEFRNKLIASLAGLDQLSAKAHEVAERVPLDSQRAEVITAIAQFQEAAGVIEQTLAITRQ